MKTLFVVDIQPEYQDWIGFLPEFVKFINNSKKNIVFLYNGEGTLDMISEYDYQEWLIENGVRQKVVDNATFYDKGYAFFRYCIDKGVDDKDIAVLVKLMYDKGINDSRELDAEFWDEFIELNGAKNLREILELSEDCLYLPDLMDFINNYNDVIICGGGRHECLKEVEICLMALNKKYKKLDEYIYLEGGNILSSYDYTIGGL